MTAVTVEEKQLIAGVRFYRVGKLYHFDASHIPEIEIGDRVIVRTKRGKQMGEVVKLIDDDDQGRKHTLIERIATPRELVLKQEWESQELDALIRCREKAAEIGKYEGVKFIKADYNYDGSWLTFFYSFEADEKLVTHPLHGALKRSFPKTRIELRQIGPRDVAKILGGYGACGIPRCCSTFLTDFSPVTIRMAKSQGISLNPSEITGMCGRLRCCLVYEYEQYLEARKTLPRRGKRVGTPKGTGKVIDVIPLKQIVIVKVDDERIEVHQSELVPLEELEALKKKAASGCEKHEGGHCDCGAGQAPTTDKTT